MRWVNFLHIYQPANQAADIVTRVANESYRPLLKTLKENPNTKITLNINAALSEQFVSLGFQDLINDIIFVATRGQIEFTGSAKYHALLPFLSEDEIIRQITLNFQTNQKIFGDVYNPKGFFPPEMAYAPLIAPIVEKLGYTWILIDEVGFNGRVAGVDTNVVYTIENTKLSVFFRERTYSNLIMSALVRREEDFKDMEDFKSKNYLVTGMDGETFGHHRPGLQKLLTGLLTTPDFEHVFIEDLMRDIPARKVIQPVISTWASTEKDIEEGNQFLTWDDPDNTIHRMQWELQQSAIETVKNENIEDSIARHLLDEALASDHFFWASARPWWSLEVIESGAWLLLDTIKKTQNVERTINAKALELYYAIIASAFSWQRTGHIKEIYKEYREIPRIPFKDKTAGEPWVYAAFIELMKIKIKEAVVKENFEEAILWRDAIWKLETKNDLYDSLHAVDLLRQKITNGDVLDMIDKYKLEYQRLASGQPEQRGI